MSIISMLSVKMKEIYRKLQNHIGRQIGIERIVRVYLPSPKTEEKLNNTSKAISIFINRLAKKIHKRTNDDLQIEITSADLCLFFLTSLSLATFYYAFKLGWWLWALETYTCLISPAMVTFHALESENHEKVGHFLVYWIFQVGFARIIETIVDVRNRFPLKYILGKSSLAFVLMNPRIEGISFISKHFILKYFLPFLGMRDTKTKRTLVVIKKNLHKKNQNKLGHTDVNGENDMKVVQISETISGEDSEKVCEIQNDEIVKKIETETKYDETIEISSSLNIPESDGKTLESNISACSNSVVSDFSYIDVDHDTDKKEKSKVEDIAMDEITLLKMGEHLDSQTREKNETQIESQDSKNGSSEILYTQAQSI